MNHSFHSLFVVASVGLAVACSQGSEDPTVQADEGALKTNTAASSLVGSWVDSGDDTLLFYAIQMNKDGTFRATGGCRSNGPGPHCFAITWLSGTFTINHGKLTLVDELDQKTVYGYSVTGDALTLTSAEGSAVFKKHSGAVHPGNVCRSGDKCTSGYECRSNCPADAECIVALDTCQPKAVRLKAGAVCQFGDESAPCADGYECRDSCPPGAMCRFSIFSCRRK